MMWVKGSIAALLPQNCAPHHKLLGASIKMVSSKTKSVAKPATKTTKPQAKPATKARASPPPKPPAKPKVPATRILPPPEPKTIKKTRAIAKNTRKEPGNPKYLTDDQRKTLAKLSDGITPLEFAMSILRDPKASMADRRWATDLLMPYMHQRLPVAVNMNSNVNMRAGVLVAPAPMSAEQWIAEFGATPPTDVDLEATDVKFT